MKKVVGRKEKFGSSSKREARFFWKGILFASPWLIGFVCFILLPVCLAFYYSFTDYNLFNEPAWVGLKNYKDAFKDQYVWKGLKNTLYMVVICWYGSVTFAGTAFESEKYSRSSVF